MANDFDRLKEEIVALISAAPNQRLRPHEVGKGLAHKLEISRHTVREAIRTLTVEGRLVFTYRDPCSFVEVTPLGELTRPAA